MFILENTDKANVILCFLLGEFNSQRFNEKLKNEMEKLNIDESLILSADINNESENKLREKLLSEFRGYGKNEGLFENFPTVEEYSYGRFDIEDIDKIKYINYSYWNELSSNTSSPLVAASNIMAGKVVYDVSNQPFIEGAELVKKGETFPPLILLTSDYNSFIVLEGHSRLTVYALAKEYMSQFECYVLKCDESELKRWNS